MITKIITPISISLLAANASLATVVLPLDFTNYVVGTQLDTRANAFGEWYDDKKGLIYQDIVDLGPSGPIIGAKIRAYDDYTTHKPEESGVLVDTNDAKVNMARGTSTLFRLSLFDQSTGAKIDTTTFGEDFSFSLSFYDLDGTTGVVSGIDQVTVFTTSQYTVLADNDLKITETVDSITALSEVNLNNVSIPDGSMTIAQERINIVFDFTNQSDVDFSYTIVGGATDSSRNLFIDGDDYLEFSGPTTTSHIAVPEPSNYALLGISAVGFISRRKR
jgi:hypothetical protein